MSKYSGPFTGGYVNSGNTVSEILVSGSTFTGNISNSGTISGTVTGIAIVDSSTITGAIIDSGIIAPTKAGVFGISVENFSEITGTQTAIKITGPTFAGGINNAGTLSGTYNGIFVGGADGFTGGITNSGTITGSYGAGIGLSEDVSVAGGITNSGGITGRFGIIVDGVQTFANNIVNSANDTITANVAGIVVSNVSQFGTNSPGGGIVNAGTINVTTGFSADGIFVGGHASFGGFSGISAFAGGISNTGTISATVGGADGIVVGGVAYSGGVVIVSTFSGDISNSGTISVGGDGVLVGGRTVLPDFVYASTFYSTFVDVETFSGNITNSGTISAGGDGVVIGGPTSNNSGVGQFTGNIVNSPSSVEGTAVPGTGTITGNVDILLGDVDIFSGNIVNETGASLVAKTGSAIEIGTQGPNLLVYNPASSGVFSAPTLRPVDNFNGSIINNGTITFSEGGGASLRAGIQIGTSYGFALEMSTFSGGITNTGTISVSSTTEHGLILGIYVSGVEQFSGGISNSGLISAHSDYVGKSGSGIVLYYDQTVVGGITNIGTIDANFGIGVVNVATFEGNVVNATNGTISGTINAGVDGIDVVGPGFTNDSTFLGSIVNQGAITAAGIGVNVSGVAQFGSPGSSTAAGNINNSGTITAATGIAIKAAIVPLLGFPPPPPIIVDTTMYGSIVDTGDILTTNHGIWIGGGATINSTATAVDVTALTFTGGILNNGAITAAHNGILVDGQPKQTFLGGITNTGSIDASNGNGIDVSNITVFGPSNGDSGITNTSTISAANGIGIDVNNVKTFDGGITNTGTISAGTGIELTNTPDVSVFDSGVITGTGGTAIQFDGPSDNTLTLAAGYSITGSVFGGGTDTLQLGGTGSASFDLSDVDTQYTGFSTFNVIGGTWTATGLGSDWNVEGGTFKVSDTASASDTTVDTGGREIVENGGTAGNTQINGGTMEVVSGGSAGSSVTFEGGGTLQIDGPNAPGSTLLSGTTVQDFALGDTIDLAGIAYNSANTAIVNGSDQLQLLAGGQTYYLQLTADNAGDILHLAPDSLNPTGTDVTMACYCRGTLIQTDNGALQVQELKIGDQLVTASGVARPIKWIGHRLLDTRRHPEPTSVWPICVSAGAFGENKPSRDLWLSPGHNIAAEGVLMPIEALQNGKTIVQHQWSTVEYWHIELDEHDIILAEGLPAESYLDTGNRTGFVNGGAFIEAHPDFKPKHWAETCMPLVQEGPEVARTKAVLLERLKALGHVTTSEADLHVIADGKRIDPIELGTRRFAFTLPTGCADIRLMSRTFIAAHTCAESSDTRSLGLCVKRLQIDGEDVPLDDQTVLGDGWNDLERCPGVGDQRWTRGSTPLPAKARLIVIDLAGPGHYWQEPKDNIVALFG
jgi:hypothetical protein